MSVTNTQYEDGMYMHYGFLVFKVINFQIMESFKGIMSTTIVNFSYPKLMSFSVLTFIK